ncbi:MAG: Unknown protein [uncultured Sulfurovum sp.]|uniref:Uncharacterized protein n=1 Tax=uncultured Sulfurovum sp. TaxID=269237 RepID=A0A6S6RZW8_9BACT|nr:MAG: Unknown protein [uncultured Sulfurovum sp.]
MAITYINSSTSSLLNQVRSKVSDLFLLLDAVAYNVKKNITIDIKRSTGGSTEYLYADSFEDDTPHHQFEIKIPTVTAIGKGRTPTVDSHENTFYTYEEEVVLAHELGHVVLSMIDISLAS